MDEKLIRQRLQELNLTRDDFQRMMLLSAATVQNILQGKQVSYLTAFYVCTVLRLDPALAAADEIRVGKRRNKKREGL